LSFIDGQGLLFEDDLLRGTLEGVAWGDRSMHLVTMVADGATPRLALVATSGLESRPLNSIARDPRDRIFLNGTRPVATAVGRGLASNQIFELGAMLRASQIAGALRRVLEMSLDYANTRQQFGRPIGKFQAIQQSLAQLAAEAAAADVAAATAWRAIDKSEAALSNAGFEAAVAKIRCGEAARVGAAIAHQVHGAIGATDEHMLHYFTRRLWSWRQEFGGDSFWAERLGRLALKEPGAALWPLITREILA
jgi:acyl-CoA dehydrogenase